MGDGRTSTLYGTERKLAPLVLAVSGLCGVAAAGLLALAWQGAPVVLWDFCLVLTLLLVGSNVHYLLSHPLPTVGMLPVATFSLLPALVAGLTSDALAPSGCRVAVVATVAIGALLVLFMIWFVRLRSIYQRHPALDADAAIIVLGAAIKRGRPCETLQRRLDTAAKLWHESPDRIIVVTGGPTPDHRTTEADEMARALHEAGVTLSSIILERTARNTRENIELSCALLDELDSDAPARQRCVISSDYHLWRALRDARSLGVELTPIPSPTPRASIPQQWCREVMTILSGR